MSNAGCSRRDRARAAPTLRSALLILAVAVAGCRTIPDLKPFSQATAEIDLAANQTHDFVVADLTALAEQAPARTDEDKQVRKALEDARDKFSAEWQIRLQATAALVDYSASLASIADAGMTGADSARALANSVNGLLAAIPTVTAQIPAATIDLAAWIKGEVDKVRAAESLAASTAQAQSVILQIAPLLEQDFATVEERIGDNVIASLTLLEYQAGSTPAYWEALIARQDAVQEKLRSALAAGTPLDAGDVAESRLVAVLLAETETRYRAYRDACDAAKRRGNTEKQIVSSAQESVRRWAKIHGELAVALAEKRTPSAALLVNKALELKELVDKLRSESK